MTKSIRLGCEVVFCDVNHISRQLENGEGESASTDCFFKKQTNSHDSLKEKPDLKKKYSNMGIPEFA